MEPTSSISHAFQEKLSVSDLNRRVRDDASHGLLSHSASCSLLVSDFPRRSAIPRKPKTTILDLPVEILDLIFKTAHSEWLLFTLHPELYSSQPTPLWMRSWRGLMRLFCQFPYTPAAVCQEWRQIILSTAVYWTRPVVFVDSRDPLTSLSILRAFIQRSRDLPLILAVVRKDYNIPIDLQEGINVALVMDVILAHLNRFNDLYFHVNQSSSLPPITRFRYRSSSRPKLLRLALHCDNDDGPNHDLGIPRFLIASHWPPSLTTLKIDGCNFTTIVNEPYTWAIVLSRLKSLSIERLRRLDSTHDPLSLMQSLELLARLTDLEVLTIRDVEFDTSDHYLGTSPFVIDVADLILDGLDADVVKNLFDLAVFNPSYLLLRNIPIDALPHVPQPNFLELVEIAIGQDIEDFLCFWDGEVLAIRDCPGFNDSILALFAEELSSSYHICFSLRELHIQNCLNFSGRGVRRMAEMRMDFASRRENESLKLNHIGDIFVTGTGPVLEREDAEWLRTQMRTFVWSTTQPSRGSSHLDPDIIVPFTVL